MTSGISRALFLSPNEPVDQWCTHFHRGGHPFIYRTASQDQPCRIGQPRRELQQCHSTSMLSIHYLVQISRRTSVSRSYPLKDIEGAPLWICVGGGISTFGGSGTVQWAWRRMWTVTSFVDDVQMPFYCKKQQQQQQHGLAKPLRKNLSLLGRTRYILGAMLYSCMQ